MEFDLTKQLEEILKSRLEINEVNRREVSKFIEMINNKIIPDKISHNIFSTFYSFEIRRNVIPIIGFILISYEWVDKLAEWINNRKVLEVMSGTGALAYALKNKGVDIIATDNYKWEFKNRWLDIENIDCIEAIKKYGKDVDLILMSWPEMDNKAYLVLKEIRRINPNAMIIYIGEGHFGCTADDEFHNSIKYVNDNNFNYINKFYNSWYGIHDRLILIR